MKDVLDVTARLVMKLEAEICCILRICCGGQHERKAKAALSTKMHRETGLPVEFCDKAAAWTVDTFDLAPHDSLKVLRESWSALARMYPEYKE